MVKFGRVCACQPPTYQKIWGFMLREKEFRIGKTILGEIKLPSHPWWVLSRLIKQGSGG
jgi:hypothetical protein